VHPHCSTPGPAVFLKFCPCSNAPVGFVQARRRPRAGYNFSLNTFSPGVASTHSTSQRDTSHYSFLLAWTWLFDYHSLIDIDNPDTHFETIKHKYHLPVPYSIIIPRLFKSTTNLSSRRERLSFYTNFTSQPHFERSHWRESLLLAGRNIAPSLLVKGTSQSPGRNVKSTQPLTGLSINSNAKDICSLRTFLAVFQSAQAKSAPAQLIRTDHRLG